MEVEMADYMRVVDGHVHLYEPERMDRPRARSVPGSMPDVYPIEEHMALMDKSGVGAVAQVTSTLMGYDNAYSLETAEKFPGRAFVYGRLIQAPPSLGSGLSPGFATRARREFFCSASAAQTRSWTAHS